jgi:RecA-family ATPase
MTDAELDQCRHDAALLRSVVSQRVQLKRAGRDFKGCCPFHEDKTPSFTVYDDGRFHCFGCGVDGTVFDYIMLRDRVEFGRAVEIVAAERGISTAKTNGDGGHHGTLWQAIMPAPSDAPPPTDQQLACDALHDYRNVNDLLLHYVRRHEARDGKRKVFIPLTYGVLNGKLGWHNKAPDGPRPLYRLNALSHAAPDAPVLLIEGEKAADAAQRLFPDYVAMTWSGGANADGGADFSPLQGRSVILWADADDAGRRVMTRIARRLPQARIIDTTDLQDGFDAADLEASDCDDPDAWLQARLRNGPLPGTEGSDAEPELPRVAFVLHRASDWDTRIIPPQRWIAEDWIPRQQVTGLYGLGGSYKTWLLMQGLMAGAVGEVFLGRRLERMPTLGLFCEDTEAEIARRMALIAGFYKRTLADFTDFHWASLVGLEEPELVTFDGSRMLKTLMLQRLDGIIIQHGIGFVGLDTLAHFYGGEEVRRREVARFLRMIDAISIGRDCAFVFTAQPSVRGRTSGTMESGSTHWDAGVRSRLSWHDPTTADADAETPISPDPTLIRRVLTRQKSNYAPAGETMELVFRDGGFTPAAVDPDVAKERQHGPGRDAACERRFLDLLAKVRASGDYVHKAYTDPSHYAPTVFTAIPSGKGFSKPEYTRAMHRLSDAGRIRLEPFGAPSRGQKQWAEVPK